jgi:ABC-type ATPase with predicted acetyltransferase domain
MDPHQPPPSDQDTHSALLFALVAERLSLYYEHNSWLTQAQGATLAANWLSRSAIRLAVSQRKHLSELSDQLARQIAESVSREAGLHISYEMSEALDERYVSEIGESIREECRRLLADAPLPE